MSYDNSAFPRKIGEQAPGMTKREYFAAKALQGLLASTSRGSYQLFAEKSVQMADHLIKALSNEKQ
jgi:hypothetical protein